MPVRPLRDRTAPAESGGLQLGRLDDFLGFRLRRLQNRLSKDFATVTAPRNLRSGLVTALAIIEANPGMSQNELSREVGLDKSVTVLLIDDLEKKGWAVRERSLTDRRRHALFVTAQGKADLDELFAILRQTESVIGASLSLAEQNLLHELLDRIYAHCTATDEGGPGD